MKTEILRMNLLFPLYYTPRDGLDPFNYRAGDGPGAESLFCFELDETQLLSIEPDREKLLGRLIFAGISAEAAPGTAELPTSGRLPRGNYLFAQKRAILSKDDSIDLAVEIQQEALWQRLIPGNRLYLRYLFEDGRWVTQLFRPCTEPRDVPDFR